MDISVDKVVNYNVNKVEVTRLTIMKDSAGKLVITVPYVWKDVDGKVLRTGLNKYYEDVLIVSSAAVGIDFAAIAGAIKQMFLPGISPYILINFLENGKLMIILTYGEKVGEKMKWNNVIIQGDQVEPLLISKGLSSELIRSLVTMFTLAIFEE